jgi:succinoglycan biosynthesis transport protein ExoP
MVDNRDPFLSGEYLPDIKDIVKTLWRQRRLIAAVFGACFVLGTITVLLRPDYYKASATVVLEDTKVNLTDFKDVTARAQFDELTVQTEVKMLLSPSLAQQTVRTLDLGKIEEFEGMAGDRQKLVAEFLDRLTVAPQGTSRVIEVTFKAQDPDLAAKVANAHVKTYLASQIEFKRHRVQQLKEWFETKVGDLKGDVVKKSRAVGDYRAEEDLAVGKDSQELIYQQITDVAAQIVPVQVHKYEIMAKLDAIDAAAQSAQPDAISDVVHSPLIQNLKTQLSSISQEAQALEVKYGARHPGLRAARNQEARVLEAIDIEVANIVGALENELVAAEAQERMLTERLESLKKQADDLRIKMITLNSLSVEQSASQKLLDSFLANYENIQSQVSFARPDAVVLSEASSPVFPAPPGKKVLLLIVAVFSGSMALAVVFVLEMLGSGIKSFKDIQKMGQTPLGILPQTENPLQVMLAPRNSGLKEAVKRIYMASLMNGAAKAILVTSALPKEGRTTLVTLLGYYMTMIGHKVLVVDADFLRPSLGQLTGSGRQPGFTDVLAGKASLADAVQIDRNGLSVLSAGTLAEISPDPLRVENLSAVFSQMKEIYTSILIDSGPVLSRSEAGVIADHADGVVVVTEWMKTSEQDLSSMFGLLKSFAAPVLGVVLNRVDVEKYKFVTSGADFLLPRIDDSE